MAREKICKDNSKIYSEKTDSKKYKMYVCNFGWITSYNNSCKMSGKRYHFEVGSKKDAIKLTFLEALGSINDCNDTYYNNWSFKLSNEKEFLQEFKQYKKKHLNDLQVFYRYVDIDNPLIHYKRVREVEWACIQRTTFCKADIFGQPENVTWYYSLTTDRNHYTSGLLGFRKIDDIYEFETFNSIYKTKKILEIPYINQIKELEDYFKSKTFKEFMKMEKEHQKQKKKI